MKQNKKLNPYRISIAPWVSTPHKTPLFGVKSNTVTATAQDERILNEKRRYLERPFDLYPVLSSQISDLNLALFSYEYLPKAFSAEISDARVELGSPQTRTRNRG